MLVNVVTMLVNVDTMLVNVDTMLVKELTNTHEPIQEPIQEIMMVFLISERRTTNVVTLFL